MILYCDGSKAKAASQILVTDDTGKILNNTIFKAKDLYTSNMLEYEALLMAVKLAKNNSTIYTDSQLCFEQIHGNYKIKKETLRPYVEDIKELKLQKKITIIWIPRGKNKAGVILEEKVKSEKIKQTTKQRRRSKKISLSNRKRSKEV
jgi:ribonuclease HI